MKGRERKMCEEQKTIVLIVPYFGKLPYNFQLWLESCRYNPTIDWILFTDDDTSYLYPDNVKVTYCTWQEMKDRIQELFDFEISLEKPYKLCDYKVAYGDIFYEEIKKYDEWGVCDIDVLFGNIRFFITDKVLEQYEKIGFQGHLMIFRNTRENRYMYRRVIKGVVDYRKIFTSDQMCFFDENIFSKVYEILNIPVYKEVHFAHLSMYHKDFMLCHLDESENYKNENQVFSWDKGTLLRHYLFENKVYTEEFLYIHFFKRKMELKISDGSKIEKLLIYPNKIQDVFGAIDNRLIRRKAHTSELLFELKYLYRNLDKFSISKVRQHIRYKKQAQRGRKN